jgi:NAD(P)H-flavin reductase
LKTRQLTEFERLLEIALEGGRTLDYEPGQFIMISLFGVGEIPVSIASSPTMRASFEICVRAWGKSRRPASPRSRRRAGHPRPYGRFPIRILKGNDLLIIAGARHRAPALPDPRARQPARLARRILLGCRRQGHPLREIDGWRRRMDVHYECTVDRAAPEWTGQIGRITTLIPGVDIEAERTFAVVVGPPVMYKFVIRELLAKNIPEQQILLSLERHMKCGMGKCGRCQIHNFYCCQDGPVFNYADVSGCGVLECRRHEVLCAPEVDRPAGALAPLARPPPLPTNVLPRGIMRRPSAFSTCRAARLPAPGGTPASCC